MPTFRSSPVVLVVTVLIVHVAHPHVDAQAPLHQRIDQHVASKSPDYQKQAASLSSDAEFVRRVFIDLTGTIPTPAQARAFFADKDPNKRAKLIDKLLASPEHARHLSEVFDVTLLERRSGKNVSETVWREFLRTSFLANKPWDQLAREILTADGVDAKNLGPAKFYLVRNAEPNLVTRDVSRLFLGMNLECSQCHDSPIVSSYHQEIYYGIYAFVNRTYVVRDKTLKRAVLGEKAEGEVSFSSVFDPKKEKKSTGPRVPGRPMIEEPKIEKGKEYKVKPAKSVRSVPAYSRFAKLGNEIARADNAQFKRNVANRLWALMMGRGLVHPLDMDHRDNPPSHPKLLELLADEIAAHKFDVGYLLREIALSKTYQLSSALPPGVEEVDAKLLAVAQLKPLSPEVFARSLLEATGQTEMQRSSLGDKLTESALYGRMLKQAPAVIAAVAGTPGEEEKFEPTLAQALFIANNPAVGGWLTPRGGNLVDRLSKLKDDNAVADEMYLSVLTRLPDAEERKQVVSYVKAESADRVGALKEYVWALLASAEFRFNH